MNYDIHNFVEDLPLKKFKNNTQISKVNSNVDKLCKSQKLTREKINDIWIKLVGRQHLESLKFITLEEFNDVFIHEMDASLKMYEETQSVLFLLGSLSYILEMYLFHAISLPSEVKVDADI